MLTRITPPAQLPVSIEEAKSHLAVIGSSDDMLLYRLIASAVSALDGPDGKLGRCLISQTWQLSLPGLVGNIRLPIPPVSAVSQIFYTPSAGSTVTLDPDDYVVVGIGSTDSCIVSPKTRWPVAKAGTIEFVAGFGDDAESVPEDIRSAILAAVGSGYAWRESSISGNVLSTNPEIADVIHRWRVRGFG